MQAWSSTTLLARKEIEQIHRAALRILADIGMVVRNEKLLKLLAEHGAKVNFKDQRVRFAAKWMEKFIGTASPRYDRRDDLQVSCLLPWGDRRKYSHGVEVTAGTYPQFYLTLDNQVIPHTLASVASMTRLADRLTNIDRLGVMGIPSDVPPLLTPLYQRLIAWKYAANKLSGCGEVRDLRLLPYIFEMGRIMADHKRAPLSRYLYAEVETISPLQFTEVEARIFVHFWENQLLCGVGFMYSAGGSGPATLAGIIAMMVAESLFVNVLYRFCYGLKKLWLMCNSSILDMKRAMFPFGRPERGLMTLAMGQMARYYRAGLWASAVYADAKLPSTEAGMQSAFNTIPSIIAGSQGLECFGLLSGAEIGSPVQLVIDNEYAGALKRFARGLEVNEETLAFDLIRELGPGGVFTGTEHTAKHYREEHWQPGLFSREGVNSWIKGDRKIDVDRARDICASVEKDYHPRNIDEPTEQALRQVIKKAEQDLR